MKSLKACFAVFVLFFSLSMGNVSGFSVMCLESNGRIALEIFPEQCCELTNDSQVQKLSPDLNMVSPFTAPEINSCDTCIDFPVVVYEIFLNSEKKIEVPCFELAAALSFKELKENVYSFIKSFPFQKNHTAFPLNLISIVLRI